MSFSISFNRSDKAVAGTGEISLGRQSETFSSCFKHFDLKQYEAQWKSALRITLTERRTSALFSSIELDDDGVGRLWLYSVIPSELAGDTASKRARLTDFPAQEDAGIFIGQRFMNVTVNISNFERRIFETYADGSHGDELALYYLDLSAPERFFGYLDDNIADCSHWYFSNEDLQSFKA
ncbi:hypothetical protein XMM379_000820 [Aliiroseovarius sp. xm-m-379]|uniref:hypothetical protein n=1 Tax=unclassified Aliiroseovarius TaxID=2623558 RepID=UPI0015681B29|nr:MULTISPECIES: hypothetical protein [unclassified Aliiroseovarius]NRP13025.1 hypothetical protein [Aliiroseovarius sp. xm-d-517]NRP24140.1 hypothetical protein [Aliiroseovarius sp. xm-m-379]NRP30048.1 hypothetical protein [Aliiroseovarius sp. xm-m-314]NRP32939.1 hypothetical protein [Aliiroseovarius sp. xm-a-104]NRP40058.1 hypothetical protein [Aliiroseovarius sp. xm-m-339-2]